MITAEREDLKKTATFSMAPKYLKAIDGLRGFAALWVLGSHFDLWREVKYHSPWMYPLHAFLQSAHFAVTLFIVLSGFCLMIPVVRRGGLEGGALQFFERRARRILPTYYASLAFAVLLTLITFGIHHPQSFERSLISHLFLIQDVYWNPFTIAPPLWSIAVEWHIYLFFPLFVRCWQRFGTVKMCVGAMSFFYVASYLIALQSVIPVWSWQVHYYAPMNLEYYGLFTLGMAAAVVSFSDTEFMMRCRTKIPWNQIALTSLIGFLPICYTLSQKSIVLDLIFALCIFCVLITISLPMASLLRQVCSLRLLTWLGSFAYSLYLVHAPISQYFDYSLFAKMPLELKYSCFLLVCIPVTILVAYAFYLLFERPYLKTRQ